MGNACCSQLVRRIVQEMRKTWRFLSSGQLPHFGIPLCVLVAGSIAAGCAPASAQPRQVVSEPVETLRNAINIAKQQNNSGPEVGGLWLRLAFEYENRLEYDAAEDAFTHALGLLRTPAAQRPYAEALGGLGALYFEAGRSADADKPLRKALAIFESTHDPLNVARLHVILAMNLLSEQRLREAEAESAEGIRVLNSLADLEARQKVAAYLTHSCALCHMGQCSAALEDVHRAMELAQANLPAASVDMMAVWLIRGYDEWKSGSLDAATQSTLQAMKTVQSLINLPRPSFVYAQLTVLRQYDAILKAAHHKPEAKQVEAEIGQLESEQPHMCRNCTVNAAALSNGLLHP
jgi:tetratricopeptide (TPR) repeat protein